MTLFGGNKSVADIVAGLNKIITQLDECGRVAVEERGAKVAQMATLASECSLLEMEEKKSGAISANLRKLLDLDGEVVDEFEATDSE